jgi:tetraacyldisaccharide 4'-kinase
MRTPRFWQSNNALSLLLTPASLLYRLGAWADRCFTKPQHACVPVISVGNVTAGGAGKTPTTLALIPLLQSLGYVPHILTRGYGGAALTAHRVEASDDWRMVGDEALLLARAAPTWAGRDRLASAHAAVAAGATVLVCDDALQHHRLHKDVSLLVVDGPFGFGNQRLLPAGPLREPLAVALARCHAALLIGKDTHHIAQRLPLPCFKATLKPSIDTAFLREGNWLAFAGIGRPEKFYDSVRSLGANLIATRDFADHHAYTAADSDALIQQAARSHAQLITTEKDYVKLPAAVQSQVGCLPIQLEMVDAALLTQFLAKALATPTGA